jgi:hypothetical protein
MRYIHSSDSSEVRWMPPHSKHIRKEREKRPLVMRLSFANLKKTSQGKPPMEYFLAQLRVNVAVSG